MPFTATDLANIDDAIASGLREAVIGDEKTTFRDFAHMMKIRRMIIADVTGAEIETTAVSYPRTSRGL